MREMVKILKEICLENNISFNGYSNDWILQLKANNRTMYVYGYKFPNNNAAVEQICNDKAALSDILESRGIPHIPHFFFISPNNKQHMPPQGNWEQMLSLLRQYGTVVCKPNNGTGGNGVFKISSSRDLECSAHTIFAKSRSLSVSPYRHIQAEYRVIVIRSKIGVIYEKKRPFITGNGIDSIKHLIERDEALSDVEVDEELDLTRVPDKDELVEVSWKHNLGQGAHPVLVTDPLKKEALSKLALSCVLALDAEFISVDIVEDEYGMEVMEINSGVMMENLARSSEENYGIAKGIYQKAILSYLGMDSQEHKYFVQKPRTTRFVLPIMEQIAQELGVAIVSYSMTHHTRQSALGLPFIEKKVYGGVEYSVSEYTMSEIIASVYEMMEQTGLWSTG